MIEVGAFTRRKLYSMITLKNESRINFAQSYLLFAGAKKFTDALAYVANLSPHQQLFPEVSIPPAFDSEKEKKRTYAYYQGIR